MRCRNKIHTKFTLNEDIEEVDQFCYLGSIITTDGGTEEDIKSRISKAKGRLPLLQPTWRSHQINLSTKLRIFQSNVKTVLLYGCETWKTNKNHIKGLQTFINRCLRRILGIRWPEVVSNEELWRRTKQTPVDIEIRRKKWRWLGYTLRREESSIARQALDWSPQGVRRRGRPRHTWRRSVEAEGRERGKMGWPQIKTMAGNRVRWRMFVDALCST